MVPLVMDQPDFPGHTGNGSMAGPEILCRTGVCLARNLPVSSRQRCAAFAQGSLCNWYPVKGVSKFFAHMRHAEGLLAARHQQKVGLAHGIILTHFRRDLAVISASATC